jgi:hypothetical protein
MMANQFPDWGARYSKAGHRIWSATDPTTGRNHTVTGASAGHSKGDADNDARCTRQRVTRCTSAFGDPTGSCMCPPIEFPQEAQEGESGQTGNSPVFRAGQQVMYNGQPHQISEMDGNLAAIYHTQTGEPDLAETSQLRPMSNVLDPISPTLPESVWDRAGDPEPKLKPHIAHWITNYIYKVLESGGYDHPEDWCNLYVTGSLTTYQYGPESDFDISLFIDSKKLPEWSRAEMVGLMVQHADGHRVPGTTFPVQAYVVQNGILPTDIYKPSLRAGYRVKGDHWIEPPSHARAHDVEREEAGLYLHAMQSADKMESLLRYEPDKAHLYFTQIHERRRRDQALGKGDYADSNIMYKFLEHRGLMPSLEHYATIKVAGIEPIRPHELSSPTAIERGQTRAVTPEQYAQIAEDGRQRYEQYSAHADGTGGMDAAWPQLREHAWNEAQQPWGGTTINAATGQPIQGTPDAYALTVRKPGALSVSVPGDANREQFMGAMDQARQQFDPELQRQGHHLGVFHDADLNRIDFDPVFVTPDRNESEAIGAYTRNVGGAYHYATGDGFWPPYVPYGPGEGPPAPDTTQPQDLQQPQAPSSPQLPQTFSSFRWEVTQ